MGDRENNEIQEAVAEFLRKLEVDKSFKLCQYFWGLLKLN